MAIINSFLCWSNTRTGSAVCGYYTLVISVVCLAFYMLRYIAVGDMKESVELKGIVYAGFMLYSFMIGVSLILLPGVYMDRKGFLLPWIYVLVMIVLYETGAVALSTTVHLEKDKILTAWEIFAVAFYCIRLVANCYCFACVVSQYQELSEGRGTYEFLFKPRWRHVPHHLRTLGDGDMEEYNPPYGANLPPYTQHNPYKQFSPPTYENLTLELDCHDVDAILPAHSPREVIPQPYTTCDLPSVFRSAGEDRGSFVSSAEGGLSETEEQAVGSLPSIISYLAPVDVNPTAVESDYKVDNESVHNHIPASGNSRCGSELDYGIGGVDVDPSTIILSSNLQGSNFPHSPRHCQTQSDVGLETSVLNSSAAAGWHTLPRRSSSSLSLHQHHDHHHHQLESVDTSWRHHNKNQRCDCHPHPSAALRVQRRSPPDYEYAVAMTSASANLMDYARSKKAASSLANTPNVTKKKVLNPPPVPVSPLTIQKRTYITWI